MNEIHNITNKFKDAHLFISFKTLLKDYTKWYVSMPTPIRTELGAKTFNNIYNACKNFAHSYKEKSMKDKQKYISLVKDNIFDLSINIELLYSLECLSKTNIASIHRHLGKIETQLEKWENYVNNIIINEDSSQE